MTTIVDSPKQCCWVNLIPIIIIIKEICMTLGQAIRKVMGCSADKFGEADEPSLMLCALHTVLAESAANIPPPVPPPKQ